MRHCSKVCRWQFAAERLNDQVCWRERGHVLAPVNDVDPVHALLIRFDIDCGYKFSERAELVNDEARFYAVFRNELARKPPRDTSIAEMIDNPAKYVATK